MMLLGLVTTVFAADSGSSLSKWSEDQLAHFFLQLAIIVGLATIFGELATRRKLPPLVGELVASILIGKTVLGNLRPDEYARLFPEGNALVLSSIGKIAICFLLFEAGLELRIPSWEDRHKFKIPLATGVLGAVFTGAIAFGLSWVYFALNPVETKSGIGLSVFISITMAISAMVVMSRILIDLGIFKSRFGSNLLLAYGLNEIVSWIALSVFFGAFSTTTQKPFWALIVLTLCLLGLSHLFGYAIDDIYEISRNHLRRRNVRLIVTLSGAFLWAWVAYAIGLSILFGFFVAGFLFSKSKNLTESTKNGMFRWWKHVGLSVFFMTLGIRTDFLNHFNFSLCLFLVTLSVASKGAGTWLSAWVVKATKREQQNFTAGFLPGGVTRLLVAEIALGIGIFSQEVFVAVVISVLVTSMISGTVLEQTLDIEPADLDRGPVHYQAFFLPQTSSWKSGLEQMWKIVSENVLPKGVKFSKEDFLVAIEKSEEDTPSATEENVAMPVAIVPGLEKPILVLFPVAEGLRWGPGKYGPFMNLIVLLLCPSGQEDTIESINRAVFIRVNRPIRRWGYWGKNRFYDKLREFEANRLQNGRNWLHAAVFKNTERLILGKDKPKRGWTEAWELLWKLGLVLWKPVKHIKNGWGQQ